MRTRTRGVFFRGEPGGFWTGYESQIRNEYDGRITDAVDFGTGGVYFFQPARGVVASDGEWFHKTIIAYDRHISTWVNGVQVSDYEDTKPEGANHRKQANLRMGTISLQAHDPTTNLDFPRHSCGRDRRPPGSACSRIRRCSAAAACSPS